MSEAAAGLGPPERLHPAALLSSLAGSLRGAWGLSAAGGYFAVQGRWEIALGVLVLFTVFTVGGAALRWSRFEYRVGEREVRIDSGLLSRTHRSLPFDRIQDVTIEQNPLWRLLGLARVRFETGGSGGSGAAKEDDGSLAAVTLSRAGEIRDLVRANRGLMASEQAAATDGEAPVFVMDLPRVLLAGVFNFSLAVVGGLVGLTQTFGQTAGFDPFDPDFWLQLLGPTTPVGAYVLQHRLASILAGAVILFVVGLGTGVLRSLLRDYSFRLDRTATGLRRRRGLLTVTDVVLPAKRAQAAIIATGPLRERFGWRELKLQSLAREESGKGDHVVAPLADDGEIGDVLRAISWRQLGLTDWRRVSLAYVWALAVGIAPLLPIIAAQALFFSYASALIPEANEDEVTRQFDTMVIASSLIIAALLIAVVVRMLAWRRYGYAIDGDRLLVRSGWWRRQLKILPLRNIQSLEYRQNFVSRWFGVADLLIGVAGGGPTSHKIKSLPAETARMVRDQLLSRFR